MWPNSNLEDVTVLDCFFTRILFMQYYCPCFHLICADTDSTALFLIKKYFLRLGYAYTGGAKDGQEELSH